MCWVFVCLGVGCMVNASKYLFFELNTGLIIFLYKSLKFFIKILLYLSEGLPIGSNNFSVRLESFPIGSDSVSGKLENLPIGSDTFSDKTTDLPLSFFKLLGKYWTKKLLFTIIRDIFFMIYLFKLTDTNL